MSVRRSLAGVLSATLAGATLVLASGGVAHADPDDTMGFAPVAADLIGVGSDTSQNALFRLANAYNSTTPTPTARLFTYAATGGGNITLPSGASIARPNGSGAGKGLLYGANNNAEIDFARSSSPLSSTEQNAGLQAFPFALDTLGVAVSNTTPSNAPQSLTERQVLDIYLGNADTWNEVGGTSTATIEPLLPQAGSGTRTFFIAELTRINGGVTYVPGANVGTFQENDPSQIQNNPNAIAPFSVGRAGLEGSALRLPPGFRANRALYNVVRGVDLGNAAVLAAFGRNGFICSDAARDEIEAAGFLQLARATRGGACGEPTTVTTTNFTTEPVAAVPTSTTVSGTSTAPRALRLTAQVTGSRTPTGTVTFTSGGTTLGTAPLQGGVATLNLSNQTPGAKSVVATYNPTADSVFTGSASGATATRVKAASAITEGLPATVAKNKPSASGPVTVSFSGLAAKPTGKVTVKEGRKLLATKTLNAGKVTLNLTRKQVGAGKSTITLAYGGNANGFGSTKQFAITFK